ncbi:MAG: ribonuclease J [Candidatus Sungbacteria bacterium]|nr:ribonuclease J [Candidatus Sungbacteria bacterium]
MKTAVKRERHYGARRGGGQRPLTPAFRPLPTRLAQPNIKPGVLRIAPLGGLQEVGRNAMFLEYGDDIIIVDLGLQFPEENMPGVDYIIPDATYLKQNKAKIRGVIVTHAHYDHIGGIPFIVPQIGNPTVYAMPLTRAIIMKRQEDFKHMGHVNVEEVRADTVLQLGIFQIEFFHVNHNIPDTVGIAIRTPVGIICHTADFKFDNNPTGDTPADYAKMARLSSEGVLLLMSDSTGAERAGHSLSERTIQENLEEIFQHSKGRIIAATFASLISRIQQLVHLAEKFDRKVVIEGYSMKSNVQITQELGYLKVKKGTLIDVRDAESYSSERVLIICTGAQGESGAALMRIAQKEHRFIRFEEGDTVIFSSSVIVGNERTVQSLKDLIYRHGADVFHYGMMDIHAGGHAQQEDLKLMINLMRPKFFMPIHGNYFMLRLHGKLAESVGIPKANIIIGENGKVVELTADSAKVTKEEVPANYVFVDGLGVGDVGEVVLRDRQMLAEDGIFVIITIVDSKTGKVYTSPDIISRGFIYLRENQELLKQVRHKVKEIVEHNTSRETRPINWAYIRDQLRDDIGQFLYQKTHRRPMVLPVVTEI